MKGSQKVELTREDSSIFCRICHDLSPRKGLITPCNCHGTINWVHRQCLEHWLTQSHSDSCELCGTVFVCQQKLPHVYKWLRLFPRALLTDAFLFSFLTPLAILSVTLCFRGAAAQVQWQNALESLCLFALGSFLLGVYMTWVGLSVRCHYKAFTEWRRNNPIVQIVWPAIDARSSLSNSFTVAFNIDEDDVFVVTPDGQSEQSSCGRIERGARLRSEPRRPPGQRNSIP